MTQDKWHGTPGGYTNHGCKCDRCRMAWNAARLKRYHDRKTFALAHPGSIDSHGTLRGYNQGCRCSGCVRANSRANTERKQIVKSPELYQSLLDSQKGVCAICGNPSRRKLNFDHDHKTMKVRGLLCSPCNTGLGKLGDTVDGLKRAIAYLESR